MSFFAGKCLPGHKQTSLIRHLPITVSTISQLHHSEDQTSSTRVFGGHCQTIVPMDDITFLSLYLPTLGREKHLPDNLPSSRRGSCFIGIVVMVRLMCHVAELWCPAVQSSKSRFFWDGIFKVLLAFIINFNEPQ